MFGPLFRKHQTPEDLLKSATQKKKEGDLDSAIGLLRKAYREIAKGTTEYPIEAYLRLPLYLQTAKRPEEAWVEFEKLLSAAGRRNDPEMIAIDCQIIYDKMRLFLKREGREPEAARCVLMSRLYEWLMFYLQKRGIRKKDVKTKWSAKELVDDCYDSLDTRTKEELTTYLQGELSKFPELDFPRIWAGVGRLTHI